MSDTIPSTKPYMLRAIFDWCADNGYTCYLAVAVDADTRVPAAYVKNGEIVLNISPSATHRLTMGNDQVQFAARFGGVSQEISVPVRCVRGIFARENGQGMFFELEEQSPGVAQEQGAKPDDDGPRPPDPAPGGRPRLQVVK